MDSNSQYPVRFTYYVPGKGNEGPALRVGFVEPDQSINPYFKGSFNWIGNCRGAIIRIPQQGIHAYPSEEDIVIDNSGSTRNIQIERREIIGNIKIMLEDIWAR